MRQFKNLLLNRMDEADRAHLTPHLELVQLKPREALVRPNWPIQYVYFPEAGQISVLAKVHGSEPIEAGMIGVEGMSELGVGGRTSLECVVHFPGDAYRISHATFTSAVKQSAELSDLIIRWQSCLISQLSYTALSHGSFTLPERLARWLLMVHDRVEGDDIPAIHDFFSHMLAVRRAGVTEALKALKADGCIAQTRGVITIVNRPKLIHLASGTYGPPEAEYARLLGISGPKWTPA